MADILRGQHSQSRCHSDAVVCSQRRTLCLHPLPVNIRLDRVFIEIMRRVRIFLTHHVHVCLEHHRRRPFPARRGGLRHQHIACLVLAGFQIMPAGKIHQPRPDFLLFLRGAGHLANLLKIAPNGFRFQSFQNSFHINIVNRYSLIVHQTS